MALVLAALAALLIVGLFVEYRIFIRGKPAQRAPSVHLPRRASGWYGADQPVPRSAHAAPGGDAPVSTPSDRAHQPHPRHSGDAPHLDGYVRGDEARPGTVSPGDVIAEHGRAGDFDMLYDPYDGGQSYESPW